MFNYAFQQLGDLTYLWSTPTDLNFTNGTNAEYYNPGTVYLLNATNVAVSICRFFESWIRVELVHYALRKCSCRS